MKYYLSWDFDNSIVMIDNRYFVNITTILIQNY